MSVHTRELNAETDVRAGLAQREAEQTEQVPRAEHPLLQMQRCFGNRFVQRAVGLTRQGGTESVDSRSGRSIHLALARVPRIQRDGDGDEQQVADGGETQVEQPPAEQAPEPAQAEPADFELTLGDTLGNPEFWRTMQLVPPLINPLAEGDVSPFSLYLLPETSGAEMLLAGEEEVQPPWVQAPPSQAGAPAEAPSVPSSATLYSVGPLQFRVVFEEPSVELPEAAQESQSRFEEGMAANEPPPGLDTESLVRGLITAFLTQTPPGQQILQGVTQVVSPPEQEGGEEGSDVSVNITVDLLPTPLMEGEPPMLIFGLGLTFP